MSVVVALSGCSDPTNERLTQQIRQQLAPVQSLRGGHLLLDLSKATDFAWDTVYFFKGEEGGEYANAKMGTHWDGPDVPNLFTRLIFVYHRKVVAYADFNKQTSVLGSWPNNFSLPIWMYQCPEKGNGIARAAAQFAVFRSCDYGYVSYPMVPLNCLAHFSDIATQVCDSSQSGVSKAH
ncbi:hypothetical protein CLV45_0359 [Hymenobacter chitinivorans DSM 11115]|uniref:Uncharacterized protein n=2 Tax=Hymenobacter chitinivorans TaxID=89969 RepID=A0A2M9BLW3_9BACT|nr:hypothetical protein CLV45_0359 [Hymenobacter chitinivorans DSM 11115]